jgi:hypothetical protein
MTGGTRADGSAGAGRPGHVVLSFVVQRLHEDVDLASAGEPVIPRPSPSAML